jgi:hypothetical protein
VKIRIGEPLTAIDITACISTPIKEKVLFGSISGYVGSFNLENKKTTYFDQIDEELIRGVGLFSSRFIPKMIKSTSPLGTGISESKI